MVESVTGCRKAHLQREKDSQRPSFRQCLIATLFLLYKNTVIRNSHAYASVNSLQRGALLYLTGTLVMHDHCCCITRWSEREALNVRV
ncbi:hypothetical protein ALP45_00318 [Pseudomonas coronafaciens pv. atropurpurea]|nr:hypothetical protein ALP45_00318 [Pseudomonas coronafaciens pv. atropurpurea]